MEATEARGGLCGGGQSTMDGDAKELIEGEVKKHSSDINSVGKTVPGTQRAHVSVRGEGIPVRARL